jgi:mono/diheme cytochrome c family protein
MKVRGAKPKMTSINKISRICIALGITTLVSMVLVGCANQSQSPAASQGKGAGAAENSQSAGPVANPTGITGTPGSVSGVASNGKVSFTNDIMPIIQAACINCHGGEKTSKGLDMKTFESLMAGSQNGAILVPGDATNSKLIQSVQSGKMPKRGPKLTPDQIQLMVDWINAGAQNN